jgi:hypothetical protein
MTPTARRWLLAAGVFVCWTCLARAEPPLPGVEDKAGLFKSETLAKAREQIQQIRETFHQDLLIETIPSLPPDNEKRVHAMTSRELVRFFDRMAKERAAAAGVNGVYILISDDPPKLRHVQVSVWPESREQTFPARDREALRKEMAHSLGKDPDKALLHAVAQVREVLKEHQPADPASTSVLWAVGGVILALLAAWVVLGVLRAKLAARDRAAPVAGVAEGNRFMPGLLGGMFGSVAGLWIYDRLFRGGPREPALPPSEIAPEEPGPAPEAALNDNENAPV